MHSKKVADILLNLGAVKIQVENPFTYASGLKGPIYCDNRILLEDLNARQSVVNAFCDVIKTKYQTCDCILAMATAGIAHGAWIAQSMQLPMGYIRSKPKEHGKAQLIEGVTKRYRNAIIIEDLVNQGSSVAKAMQLIKDEHQYSALISIVDYEMPKAKELIRGFGIEHTSLTNFSELINAAQRLGKISETDVEQVLAWHANPGSWA